MRVAKRSKLDRLARKHQAKIVSFLACLRLIGNYSIKVRIILYMTTSLEPKNDKSGN